MDEQLKARLIGATILVILAVLLIPELLSGRKGATPAPAEAPAANGMRTYTIDLSARSASGTSQTPPAEPPATEPAAPATSAQARPSAPSSSAESAGATPAPVAQASPPPAQPSKAAASPPAEAKLAQQKPPAQPRTAAAAASGDWSVQVGAFGAEATSRKLVADLKSAGYTAYISPLTKGGKTLHRVRVGPVATRADAERLAARLKSRGLPVSVVGND